MTHPLAALSVVMPGRQAGRAAVRCSILSPAACERPKPMDGCDWWAKGETMKAVSLMLKLQQALPLRKPALPSVYHLKGVYHVYHLQGQGHLGCVPCATTGGLIPCSSDGLQKLSVCTFS